MAFIPLVAFEERFFLDLLEGAVPLTERFLLELHLPAMVVIVHVCCWLCRMVSLIAKMGGSEITFVGISTLPKWLVRKLPMWELAFSFDLWIFLTENLGDTQSLDLFDT
jgi:hypothetical protein